MSLELAVRKASARPYFTDRGKLGRTRMAAVLDNGWVSHIGHNQFKTHPLAFKFSENHAKVCIHCELDAILKAIRWKSQQAQGPYKDVTDLSDYTMYVARVLVDGTAACARPCEGCFRALASFNITKVEWTT